jgi:hypothetical protein
VILFCRRLLLFFVLSETTRISAATLRRAVFG